MSDSVKVSQIELVPGADCSPPVMEDFSGILAAMGIDMWVPLQASMLDPLDQMVKPVVATTLFKSLLYIHPQQAGINVIASFSVQEQRAKAEHSLLKRMLAAIGYLPINDTAVNQVVQPSSQPNVHDMPSSDLDLNQDQHTHAIGATLQLGGLPESVNHHVDPCSLGEASAGESLLAKEVGQRFATHSLADIEQDPDLKPQVWQVLKNVRQYLQQA